MSRGHVTHFVDQCVDSICIHGEEGVVVHDRVEEELPIFETDIRSFV